MNRIESMCRDVVESVDGGTAARVVDIVTGRVLGVHDSTRDHSVYDDAVAAAVVALFGSIDVGPMWLALRKPMEEDSEVRSLHFHEFEITTERGYHLAKLLKTGKSVMVLETAKTSHLGVGWAQLAALVPAMVAVLSSSSGGEP